MLTQTDKALRLVERFGSGRDGEFSPESIPISQLAEEYGTPFYLYHGEMIEDRVRAVRKALGPDVELLYSVKANPSLAVCQLIAGTGQAGAEIASEGELVVAQAAGFSPENIVFAGPGKTHEELCRAIEGRIYAVNAESLSEIDRLAAIAERAGTRAGIGLRVNPNAQLMGSQMRMGGAPGQFGMDQDDLEEAIRKVMVHPPLLLRGIHVYTATQVFDVDALLEHCQNILEIALGVADLSGQPLPMIDFGGGFGIPYFEKTAEFDLDRFANGFRDMLARYRPDPRLSECRFIIELGRYLVAEAGIYVTRAVDVKRSRGKTIVVTDGGMNHHMAATGNLGQVFRKAYPILDLSRMQGGTAGEAMVVGPCCTPADTFGTNVPLPEPKAGDLIGVFYSGAYGFSTGSLGFLSHPSPAEVLLRKGEPKLLRQAGKAEDALQGQRSLRA